MDLVAVQIQQYAEENSTEESPLLKEVATYTQAHIHTPRMLSGHLQGRLLALFSHMIKPSAVLEIGTYTGYSALCLAEGLRKGGSLITIDNDASLAKQVRAFFAQSPWHAQIDLRVGEATTILPTLAGPFDLVFIDADKENYLRYYDLVINKVVAGGYIIADNLLWSGKVLYSADKQDKRTKALVAFSRRAHADDRVENVLLPIRDGLMVFRKLP